ncbi:DNA polymerase III subunit delta [Sphingomonas aliaeris]|uniref:DNA-directed DNA polymerase n=1 Tax=Sphingomonas aliaeris TaxID=2759526 RepID=A0A974NUI3_9SPHN|nr:DNA polymerase III subunit delta [Sphingomonas aliaeris]QQV77165.1 DNA polymerase III subunit delta [Sphingomonas aliaeris]
MKANANQIRAAIDAASPDIRLFLLHGPDEAGAQDLAVRLARKMGPEAERVDLEPSTLKSNPGRLADEAASMSLFGGARHIRIAGAGEECLEAFSLLLDTERAGNPVVAISPNLKGTAKVVKLAQGSPRAMAFACYVPEGAEADKIVSTIARELGMRTTGDTATRIAAASGGDRAVMTRELEKLALYLDAASDRPREIDDAALDAVGADLGDTEISRVIDAAIDGRPDTIGAELARLEEAGVSPIPVLRQLARRLMNLAELRAQVDAGSGVAQVTESVFFREKAITARALRHWRSDKLADAIDRIRQAERAMMGAATAGSVLAQAAIVAIGRMAARQR